VTALVVVSSALGGLEVVGATLVVVTTKHLLK